MDMHSLAIQKPIGRWLNEHLLHHDADPPPARAFAGDFYQPAGKTDDVATAPEMTVDNCLMEAGICHDRASCLLGESLCHSVPVGAIQ